MHRTEEDIWGCRRVSSRLISTGWKEALAFLFFLSAGTISVSASDYSDVCHSGDNSYMMLDGELYDNSTYESQPEEAEPIPAVVLGRQVLRMRQGYCLSDKDQPKRSHHYQYENQTYLVRVRIVSDDQTQEVELVCEKAADGLPANRDCDEDVVTKDEVTPIPFKTE